MTNEELAVLIQSGDDGYLPTLWEQVRKLIRIKAERYSRWLSENSKHIHLINEQKKKAVHNVQTKR